MEYPAADRYGNSAVRLAKIPSVGLNSQPSNSVQPIDVAARCQPAAFFLGYLFGLHVMSHAQPGQDILR